MVAATLSCWPVDSHDWEIAGEKRTVQGRSSSDAIRFHGAVMVND